MPGVSDSGGRDLNRMQMRRIWDALSGFISAGRFPHALFFYGGGETERKTLADHLAQALLCERSGALVACNECNSCRKAAGRIHPDIIYVKEMSDNGKYKVDVLREEIRRGSYLPNDGRLRIYVFAEADTMSEICQNTLLKFIEEPKSFNRFIFCGNFVFYFRGRNTRAFRRRL